MEMSADILYWCRFYVVSKVYVLVKILCRGAYNVEMLCRDEDVCGVYCDHHLGWLLLLNDTFSGVLCCGLVWSRVYVLYVDMFSGVIMS